MARWGKERIIIRIRTRLYIEQTFKPNSGEPVCSDILQLPTVFDTKDVLNRFHLFSIGTRLYSTSDCNRVKES